jgi:outer membrane protein assembly factor BamB
MLATPDDTCCSFTKELFKSSLNSLRNAENLWDKMASCPTFAGEKLTMTSRKTFALSLRNAVFLFILTQLALAQDWPQWRGPRRDGVVTGFTAPQSWPAQLKQRWKVQVGAGHSSPVVVSKRVYLHSRVDENEVVRAFDLDTGKQLWQDSYAVPYQMNPAATGHGKGPKSTPVISNGKLYTYGITSVLSCYNAATGKLLWRKEYKPQFKNLVADFGTAMSPVVDRGLLILHAGGNGNGALLALDANTGAEKWRWNGDGPAYASPIVVELGGKRQVVTQSQRNIIGVAEDNGALLWKIPFETAYLQNIVTPLQYKDLLIFSGIDKGVFAVRLSHSNNAWKPEQVWMNKEVSLYMNSPVLEGDVLCGFSHKNKGQYFCLDPNTGKTLWTSDPRQGDNAALVTAGGLVYALDTDANLKIFRASNKGLQELKRYTVADSATWAHPVLTGNRVVVKDAGTLAVWAVE